MGEEKPGGDRDLRARDSDGTPGRARGAWSSCRLSRVVRVELHHRRRLGHRRRLYAVVAGCLRESARRLRHDRADRSFGGAESVIFRRPEFAAHEHMLLEKSHAACDWLKRGEMDFARARRGDDALDVARCDATAWHDDDAIPDALHELNNEWQSLENSGFLAGSQHAIDAKPDQRLDRPERIGGDVERGETSPKGGGQAQLTRAFAPRRFRPPPSTGR